MGPAPPTLAPPLPCLIPPNTTNTTTIITTTTTTTTHTQTHTHTHSHTHTHAHTPPAHPRRPSAHDLDFKSRRVVEFLRDKHPVRVVVTLSMPAWRAEEPLRREVFAHIVRAVSRGRGGAEWGVGAPAS